MKVQLFVTCLIDSLFPEVGESVVEVLNLLGVEVEFLQDQTCCGQPAYNTGLWKEARNLALRNLKIFEKSDDYIVIPSGSCTAMIRKGYKELFLDDPKTQKRLKPVTGRCFEFSQFIVNFLNPGKLPKIFNDEKIGYFPSCHLSNVLSIKDEPIDLLTSIGFNPMLLDRSCCGFGGVFSVEHSKISTEMMRRKLQEIADNKIDNIIGCDVSCLMQIEGGLRKAGIPSRCSHLAQALLGKEKGLR